MTKETNNKTEVFISQLSKPWVWILIFLFFVVLPIAIFYVSFKTIAKNDMNDSLEATQKFYNGELIAFREKAANKKIFLQLFRGFGQRFKRAMPDEESELIALDSLKSELPNESLVVLWNKNLKPITNFCSTELLTSEKKESTKKLIEQIADAYSDYSHGKRGENNVSDALKELKEKENFKNLFSIESNRLPLSKAFVNPDVIISIPDSKNPGFFYWNFFNSKNNDLGAFLIFIPRRNLSPIFGISKVINRDPTANPDYSNGYLNVITHEMKTSYAGLASISAKLLKRYLVLKQSPVKINHWVLNVLPMKESSEANVFSVYSVKAIEDNYRNRMNNSLIVAIILVVFFAFNFIYYFKKSISTGLSLKKKLAALFFLCMVLPISILILLGLRFSASQEKILTIEADSKLSALAKQIDNSANEFYRSFSNWLSSIKKMKSVKNCDNRKIVEQLKEKYNSGQIENLYIVDLNGKIIFDMDNVSGKTRNWNLIQEIGKRVLTNSTNQINDTRNLAPNTQVIIGNFIDVVALQTGSLHLVIWPGTAKEKFIFTDIMVTKSGEARAIITLSDKMKLDKYYLRKSITNYYKVDKNIEIFAINADDISDSLPNLSMTFKASIIPALSVAKIRHEPRTDIISGNENKFLTSLYRGQEVNSFVIGTRIDWNKIVESIRNMYTAVILALIVTLLASFILVTMITKEFLYPVLVLSRGAKDITNGNLNPVFPEFAKDELGELSETFKFMTKRLRNRLTELTVLYNLTQKASTSHNQREIFGMAAKELKDHLEADHSTMAWTNDGEGDATLYIVDSRSQAETEAINLNAIKALNTAQSTKEYYESIDMHILSIPLYFEDKKFGTVCLFFKPEKFKDNETLSDDEKSFIETLRHHLSLIIEKQRLFEQAITDGLTKLYVRRFFLATLDKEMSRARRYDIHLSAMMIDIDHFKQFNDDFGHQAGDMVLRETAQRILESIRTVDTPGRYGGEEIAVILPQTPIKDAYIVSERIRKAIGNTEYRYKESVMKVTVSIGVSSISSRDIYPETIIEEADKALYRAKEKGRNQVQIAPEAM